jgi:hypothetical protein
MVPACKRTGRHNHEPIWEGAELHDAVEQKRTKPARGRRTLRPAVCRRPRVRARDLKDHTYRDLFPAGARGGRMGTCLRPQGSSSSSSFGSTPEAASQRAVCENHLQGGSPTLSPLARVTTKTRTTKKRTITGHLSKQCTERSCPRRPPPRASALAPNTMAPIHQAFLSPARTIAVTRRLASTGISS